MKPALLLLLSFFLLPACDSGTEVADPMTIRITHPADSVSILPDSTVRIMTEVTSPCGCSMHAEFFVNGEHTYSDFVPYYTFDWTAPPSGGWYTIRARAVKDDNSVDAWDSIHVFVGETVVTRGRNGFLR